MLLPSSDQATVLALICLDNAQHSSLVSTLFVKGPKSFGQSLNQSQLTTRQKSIRNQALYLLPSGLKFLELWARDEEFVKGRSRGLQPEQRWPQPLVVLGIWGDVRAP